MTKPLFFFDEIGLKNFKAWKKETFFPIDSINLIFGPNSSGKSSIFQALLLLKESALRFNPLTYNISPNAPFNDLKFINKHRDHGTWNDIIHGGRKISSNSREKRISLEKNESVEITFRITDIERISSDFISFCFSPRGRSLLINSRQALERFYRGKSPERMNRTHLKEFSKTLPSRLERIDVKLVFKLGKLENLQIYFNKDRILNQNCEDGVFTKTEITHSKSFWHSFFGVSKANNFQLSSSFLLSQETRLSEIVKITLSTINDLTELAKTGAKSQLNLKYSAPKHPVFIEEREEKYSSNILEGGIMDMASDVSKFALGWKRSDLLAFVKLKKKPVNETEIISFLDEYRRRFRSSDIGTGSSGTNRITRHLSNMATVHEVLAKNLLGSSPNKIFGKRIKKLEELSIEQEKIHGAIQDILFSSEWEEEIFSLTLNYARKFNYTNVLEINDNPKIQGQKKHKEDLLLKDPTLWAAEMNVPPRFARNNKFKEFMVSFDDKKYPLFPFSDRLKTLEDIEKSFVPKAQQLIKNFRALVDNLRQVCSVLMSLEHVFASIENNLKSVKKKNIDEFINGLDRVSHNIFENKTEELPRNIRFESDLSQLTDVDTLAFYIDTNRNYQKRLPRERDHLTLTTFLKFLTYSVPQFLLKIEWIPPHRQPPKRFIREENSSETSEYASILKVINNPDRIRLIDDALASLELPYKLKPVGKEIAAQLLHKEITLLDKNQNAEVSILDVGYGVSQVLPIIFKAFSKSERIILVEQPELHIHPRLQANLADIFALSAYFLNNTFLLETHSENLMLRYQRRLKELLSKDADTKTLEKIKQTLIGDFKRENYNPGWLGDLTKSPNFYVSLYSAFLEQNSKIIPIAVTKNKKTKKSECKEIKLKENGEFIDDWPDGFFDERFVELGLL